MPADLPDLSALPDSMSLAEIAAARGVEVSTVRAWVRQQPRPEPKRQRPPLARGRQDVVTQEVADLYRAGRTMMQIAEQLSCGLGTVQRRLQLAGVPTRPRPDPDIDAEIVRRYRAGERLPAISAAVGRNVRAVTRGLRRQGVKPARKPRVKGSVRRLPNGGRRPDINTAEVVALRAAGWSQLAIAAKFECSRAAIAYRLRQADRSTASPSGR
jgi:transposase